MSEQVELHLHLHIPSELTMLLSDRHLLHDIIAILNRMEAKMPTIDDLNAATDAVQGVLTSNDARVAALATAVSDAASVSSAHDADLAAQIAALQAQIAAGSIDPAALQPTVDKLVAMSIEAQTEGSAIDNATTALAAAFPKPVTPPAPATP